MKRKVLRVLAGALAFGTAFCTAMGVSTLKVSAETEYEYDDLNRLTEERHDDGTVILYSYDANGNLLDVEVKDGHDEGDPDESSDQNPDKDLNGSFGGNGGEKGGAGLGNNGKSDEGSSTGNTGNDGNGKNGNGQESAAGNHGENGTKDLSEGSREEIGGSSLENSSGQEETGKEGAFGNDGGNRMHIAKILTALVVLTAALSGGIFAWKRRKKNEEGEGEKRE